MSSQREPAVEAITGKYWSMDFHEQAEFPIEEWRSAFESFQQFAYSSPEAQQQDLESIVSVGLSALTARENWDECLDLARFALSDAQIWNNPHLASRVCHYKSLAWRGKGERQRALSEFLKDARPLLGRMSGNIAYTTGLSLFVWEKWRTGSSTPKSSSYQQPVPRYVLSFIRRLVMMHYPARKLPPPLRMGVNGRFSWNEVHKALRAVRHGNRLERVRRAEKKAYTEAGGLARLRRAEGTYSLRQSQ